LGTELRAIRHGIELVRATTPPAYHRGFRLPGARWGEYHEALASDPSLYAAVETAYVAVHHLNQALDFREGRSPGSMQFGVMPDDELDNVYDAAGDALTALGLQLGPTWESAARRAARGVAEDILQELNAPQE
jgi:hypothetical protein